MDYEAIFQDLYKALNSEQQKAVDTIDGPVLVVAGPGSGKTQLLSLRVANILRRTDTPAQAILCLTFTDSASANMRKRLADFIGYDAYKVNIHTYHAFATEIINQNPEYFYDGVHYEIADELLQYEIIEEILKKSPHSSLLNSYHPEEGYVNLRDILGRIGDLKNGGIKPEKFKNICLENKEFIEKANLVIIANFPQRISPSSLKESISTILSELSNLEISSAEKSLGNIIISSLEEAWQLASATQKINTKPITSWKSTYLSVNKKKEKVLNESKNCEKLLELADIYEAYQQALLKRGLHDYNDLLINLIDTIKKNPDLLYSLQEKYLYILVDEFQDSNGIQVELLNLLTDSEINEGKPNIMVVGDDDQAIYKFQGASVENIIQFRKKYPATQTVVLTKNYRSHQNILNLLRKVILKGENRLENIYPEIVKDLRAANPDIRHCQIVEQSFPTEFHEQMWIAGQIQMLLQNGHKAEEIAIIGRKHYQLESLAKLLDHLKIPINYERKKNLFFIPHIKELLTMLEYVSGINGNISQQPDHLLPEILAFPFWQLERLEIWKIGVEAYRRKKLWLEIMLEHQNEKIRNIAEFFITLGVEKEVKTAEEIIDLLTGSKGLSPYKEYYFSAEKLEQDKRLYLEYLGALQALIEKVRQYKGRELLYLDDLMAFIKLHSTHHLPLTYTSRFFSDENSVSLLTAHKAKGLEFESVFIIHCHENSWIRDGKTPNISLPPNLMLSPEKDNWDDKLRLFFVALSRAKENLYLTYNQQDDRGKENLRLRFLEELNEDQITKIPQKPIDSLEFMQLKLAADANEPHNANEAMFLQKELAHYKLSVTHLNNFLDVSSGGPQRFFRENLLKFPQRPSLSGSYGSAVHDALNIFQQTYNISGQLPTLNFLLKEFEKALQRQRLNKEDFQQKMEQGNSELDSFYRYKKQQFNSDDRPEFNFSSQNVMLGNAELTGKLDRLRIDEINKEILVFDYKTGKPLHDWKSTKDYDGIKSWKYKNQLIFYKILVENSRNFGGKYSVNRGVLEFIQPDDGEIVDLTLEITAEDLNRMKKLIAAVHQKIMQLDFPDTADYLPNLQGILEFEEFLIQNFDSQ